MNGNYRFVSLFFLSFLFPFFFVFLHTCTTGLISKGLKNWSWAATHFLMKCFNYNHPWTKVLGQLFSFKSFQHTPDKHSCATNSASPHPLLTPPPILWIVLKRSSDNFFDLSTLYWMGIGEEVDDFLKDSTAFPNVTCDSHRTSVMLLKPFFQGQVDITTHSRYFQRLCCKHLKKRLGYVKLYKINIDNWMILLTNHSQLNKSRNIRKYKLTQKSKTKQQVCDKLRVMTSGPNFLHE